MITKHVQEFLSHFPKYHVQTLDDKSSKGAIPYRAAISTLVRSIPGGGVAMDDLESLNKQGAGIFFSPNQFPEERKKEKCVGVNAWIMEMDGIPKKEQWQKLLDSPMGPSLIVESGNSYHCYWLSQDGTIENYDRIVRGLIQYFGADPACKDISRVFRIPGFYHQKREPFLVRLELADYHWAFTEKEMMGWYPYEEKKFQEVIAPHKPMEEGLAFWEALARLDTKIVLQRMSGTAIVHGEQFSFRKRSGGGEHIDVNGKPADAWLDIHGMIGSGKRGGPTFVQWAGYYGWSKGDIAKWVKENCRDLLPKSALSGVQKKEIVVSQNVLFSKRSDAVRSLSERVAPFTWGVDILDREFPPLFRGRYIVLVGETGVGKTSFSWHFARKNAEKGLRVLYLSLEMGNDGLAFRYARERLGITEQEIRQGMYDKEMLVQYISELPETLIGKELLTSDTEVDLEYISEVIREGWDMVFLDNFGYVDTQKGDSLHEKMAVISRKMVQLKNETDTTIIALHHFRKRASGQSHVRSIDEMLGSSKIGHDVDFVIQVSRDLELDEDAFSQQKSEFCVALSKDRDFGKHRMVKVFYKNGEFFSSFV